MSLRSEPAAQRTFNGLSNDADNVRMLQLNHDAELLLKLRSKLLVHGLFQSLDGHVLNTTVLVRVLTLEHLTVMTLHTATNHVHSDHTH